MHQTLLLTTLTTLLTLISAIPLSSSSPNANAKANPNSKTPHIHSLNVPLSPSKPSPTMPTGDSVASTKASSLTHTLATLIAHDASASYDLTTCPMTHASRQCCTSITKLADDTTSQLGDIVPWVSGVKVSSLIGLQCKGMARETPNDDCYESVMCCSGNGVSAKGAGAGGNTNGTPDGSPALFKSGCIPFDEAIEDKKKAIEKSKSEVSFLAEMSPTPRPTASASASPTATAARG
ncbi:hypothetical protein ASPCAL02724 [Aspergillus calidoustus]|uniref:Hydrophobin n=1 Tax=Aspergillus calidoustus TaxID=454130 RepID=A0A0U5GNN7_ASPCI|nr:hypothetical protein ASPCAL02724 [Aspergillus calidoustus]